MDKKLMDMTGPAEGKIPIEANVFLMGKKIDADVYVHLKGFALAKVTHLDIESEELNIMKGKGDFLTVVGIDNGLEIPSLKIRIISKRLKVLKSGERTRTWVGQKIDGIYIGFRKEQIRALEKIVSEK
jgi:hypothetical protein